MGTVCIAIAIFVKATLNNQYAITIRKLFVWDGNFIHTHLKYPPQNFFRWSTSIN